MTITFRDCRIAFFFILLLAGAFAGRAQSAAFSNSRINIDQDKLVKDCKSATDSTCFYKLMDVLRSGGDFWTTPFLPYDPVNNKTGDGYGEGVKGPRSAQRNAFNPHNAAYPFLRLNGLDSQSCFECHNSTGSEQVDSRGALIRKPYTVAGSAGSNSNAFINPLYPSQPTLFIRQPPAVFGSGYQQAVGDEMTMELWLERDQARISAKKTGIAVTVPLVAKGISFGTFTTQYTGGKKAVIQNAGAECIAATKNPEFIGGEAGFTDNLADVQGVSCDLVIRPLQWKGVASSLRHFVRDALDFHLSMQAFEKVALCDCDKDEKGTPATGPEVTIGNVTAMTSFVAMTRPPVQLSLVTEQERVGQKIFFGDKSVKGLYKNMCANCHVGQLKLQTASAIIEWPTNAENEFGEDIDPGDSATWPIIPVSCPAGKPLPTAKCPMEAQAPDASLADLSSKNRGALVSPAVSSEALALVHRYRTNLAAFQANLDNNSLVFSPADTGSISPQAIKMLREPLPAKSERIGVEKRGGSATSDPLTGRAYVIPLSLPAGDLSAQQLPRLTPNPDGSVEVPLLSDLKRHNMGTGLSDPGAPLPTQGTDVENINTIANQFMTRPLWGVADTGPWLHDGRALTLRDAILMHGDRSTGSEAGPVIEAFMQLHADEQDAVVAFLLTLRLPPPGGFKVPPDMPDRTAESPHH